MATNPKILKERREYNTWVANETFEDYSLRYAPKSFRKWSEFLVANTALGGISFLALEAIGGSLVINYGFSNTFWAISLVSLIIFLAGIPIAYYAGKYNIDMDLLTRGAGFGYIGSTITSVIYASFTFIFFALEAAIMAQALNLYVNLPLSWGYLLCSLIIIPMVFYGVTFINRLQLWTQPLWLVLMIMPYLFVLHREPEVISRWLEFGGNSPSGAGFDPLLFGAAATVSFSLIAQLGEQVDYLRFLPDREFHNRRRWWFAAMAAGPGWIVLGWAKQIGGAFLAFLALEHGISLVQAKEPVYMYLAGFQDVFSSPETVLGVVTLFVVVSQIKINVTNAYAGSLAWSNFFSRLTHNHPGRVVWLIFNVTISLLLMELGVFETLEAVLGLYSNVAIAWIGALVADLVINKPLGWSPSYIEFKRAHLYNINPVGFGATVIASLVAITAFVGTWGDYAQAYSPFLALGLAFILSPILAKVTGGRFYIARVNPYQSQIEAAAAIATMNNPNNGGVRTLDNRNLIDCCLCEQSYEVQDMAHCPVYEGPICSLCCSLDSRCHDRCKPTLQLGEIRLLQPLQSTFESKIAPHLDRKLLRFLGAFTLVSSVTGLLFVVVAYLGLKNLPERSPQLDETFFTLFLGLYAPLLVILGIASWWYVLSEESRELAEEELAEQNQQLAQEIQDRQQAQQELEQLTQTLEHRVEERTEELSQALKTLKDTQAQLVQTEKMSGLGQLVAGVAHEINNPVNFIYGNLVHADEYIQDLLEFISLYEQNCPTDDPEVLQRREEIELEFIARDIVKILGSMRVGAERIREIVSSLRNFSRLDEAQVKPVDLHEGIESTLTILGNRLKARSDRPEVQIIRDYAPLPLVLCHAGSINQVFMNILVNALDALDERDRQRQSQEMSDHPSHIRICTQFETEWVRVIIEDNGLGIPETLRSQIFDPFFTTKPIGKGTGLGMSICYQIVTEKHGGNLYYQPSTTGGAGFVIELPREAKTMSKRLSCSRPQQ
ncbi:histidine kinase [Geitlerinema sp. P-1104]|uniref:ATP-binding protein n=1 Tax=Geitlerinema sp. P-1104 TaxID=2546230 RepID=UPI0014774BE6|nr:ATP-binding protein [Geitlerinema sp. P-1104]NMG59294.1 histidine kinase [Geitlerinema sp. P-1104]